MIDRALQITREEKTWIKWQRAGWAVLILLTFCLWAGLVLTTHFGSPRDVMMLAIVTFLGGDRVLSTFVPAFLKTHKLLRRIKRI